ETRNPEPETRSPRPEARDPKPETRKPKTEARDPKPQAPNPEPQTRNPKPQTACSIRRGPFRSVRERPSPILPARILALCLCRVDLSFSHQKLTDSFRKQGNELPVSSF
ncbi:hypothetical protein T484DRAFT_1635349, partial [Baffinella frigidus]